MENLGRIFGIDVVTNDKATKDIIALVGRDRVVGVFRRSGAVIVVDRPLSTDDGSENE